MLETILNRPSTNFPIDLLTYAIVFGESLLLGSLLSFIYRKKKAYLSEPHAFSSVIILMAPTVATILLFIGSNLALSIGLVGSLSIIRFRTVIKDPLDLMYLFILIAIGLGCGTQNYLITAVAAIFLSAILYFIHPKNRSYDGLMILGRDPDQNKVVAFGKALLSKYPQISQDRIDFSPSGGEAIWTADHFSQDDLKGIEALGNAELISNLSIIKHKRES